MALATVTSPVSESTLNVSVPSMAKLTGDPSGSDPFKVYTDFPMGVFSTSVNWFMSAVKEGGRLRAWPEPKRRKRMSFNLVIMLAGMFVCLIRPEGTGRTCGR